MYVMLVYSYFNCYIGILRYSIDNFYIFFYLLIYSFIPTMLSKNVKDKVHSKEFIFELYQQCLDLYISHNKLIFNIFGKILTSLGSQNFLYKHLILPLRLYTKIHNKSVIFTEILFSSINKASFPIHRKLYVTAQQIIFSPFVHIKLIYMNRDA